MRFPWTAVAAALLVASGAGAEPLVPAGDGALRRDVQLLRAAGALSGPVEGYPLAWRQLTDPAFAGRLDVPDHVVAAALRVLREAPSPGAFRLEGRAAGAGSRTLFYDFGAAARAPTDLSLAARRTWGSFTARLAVGYRSGDGVDEVVVDGSYLALDLGDWTLYGGAPDRWYGPGTDAGLVLGRTARPVPGVGVFRAMPRRSDSWLLRWMGPWRFEAFLGRLDGNRDDFANPLLLNMQLALQPWPRFDLSLHRGITICGEGRPCGAGTWARALIGVFDLDNPGDGEDPANQNASVGMSYAFTPGDLQVVPLMEFYLEDEFNYVSVLLGGRVTGPLRGGAAWSARLEYTDTYANRILGILGSGWLAPTPGLTYDHFIYTDGYTHRGDWIGHSIGGDGKLGTVEARVTASGGSTAAVRYRHAYLRINDMREPVPEFLARNAAEADAEMALGLHRTGVRVRWLEHDGWTAELLVRLRVDVGG